ncbi:MAG: hypothetical protein CBC38_00965 [Gammaproteobacteria bacterium TMED78]|nr:MAG: hypothetical protein CBC38_00965 [Gammaproteobacteria bacterium TMED78]|tara:strand:- start:35173 stop:36507 length:1335 start_codon:yes stop_codon:yes gene_type:complete
MSDIYPNKTKMLGFSLPALGLNTLVTAIFVFVPVIYAEHRGMDPALVGLIFFLAKIVDMVAAPIWGNFMDTHRTKFGRRRPWLIVSVAILVPAVFMLFNPPDNVSTLYLFSFLAMLYIGWDAWTISHTSWALELSRDYDRRSRITGLLQVMSMLGAIITSLVPATLERMGILDFETKTSIIGWAIIFILPITAFICVLSVPERRTDNKSHIGFKKGLSILMNNFALLRLLTANILISFSTYFVQGLFIFFVSYTLRLQDWTGMILTSLLVGGLIGLPVWLFISQKVNKHRTVQIAMLTGTITPISLLFIPPENIFLSVLAFLIVGLNTSANEFLPRTMMADVCDKDHIETGSERMGLYYSILQLSSKFASGTGILIGFSFLSFFGFDPELGIDNPQESLDRLRYLIVLLPIIANALVIILMLKYPISREDQKNMRKIIESKESN